MKNVIKVLYFLEIFYWRKVGRRIFIYVVELLFMWLNCIVILIEKVGK